MGWDTLAVFLTSIAVGSYLQATTGFALALVVVGSTTILNVANIAMSAAVVSIVVLANVLSALRHTYGQIQWGIFLRAALATAPGTVVGVFTLSYLTETATLTLRFIFGLFVVLAACLILFNPKPRDDLSLSFSFTLAGGMSGFCGGLFGTAGPPLVYHMYRQPLSVGQIRSTILAVFFVFAASRVSYVVATAGLSMNILRLSVLSLPIVAVASDLGVRFPMPLSDAAMRCFAFVLLTLIGTAVMLSSVLT